VPKIIEIRKYLFKLQLKLSGVFFETHCSVLHQCRLFEIQRSVFSTLEALALVRYINLCFTLQYIPLLHSNKKRSVYFLYLIILT